MLKGCYVAGPNRSMGTRRLWWLLRRPPGVTTHGRRSSDLVTFSHRCVSLAFSVHPNALALPRAAFGAKTAKTTAVLTWLRVTGNGAAVIRFVFLSLTFVAAHVVLIGGAVLLAMSG